MATLSISYGSKEEEEVRDSREIKRETVRDHKLKKKDKSYDGKFIQSKLKISDNKRRK